MLPTSVNGTEQGGKINLPGWRMYKLIMIVIQYILPLGILSITYGHMAKVLWSMTTPGQANDQRDMAILANKKKVCANVNQRQNEITSFDMHI